MLLSALDEEYLAWLERQVPVRPKNRTYTTLLTQLHCKEFVWFVPNDDNRASDGRDLRSEFIDDVGIEEVDPEWEAMGCSMLELLYSLARHLAFEAGGEAARWFWQLIDNLGLFHCTDNSGYRKSAVDEILDRVIWRTYLPNGQGGLFPLKVAEEDQREVELWYQLSAYVLERL